MLGPQTPYPQVAELLMGVLAGQRSPGLQLFSGLEEMGDHLQVENPQGFPSSWGFVGQFGG